jgi:hypothetical protein
MMKSQHGKLNCRKCFDNISGNQLRLGDWKIQNDPCYWGSSKPEVLVLGFSKGLTQANAFKNESFETIPFKGMRDRLTSALRALNVIEEAVHVNQLISDPNSRVAFASLIRCSVSRLNEKKSIDEGQEVFECTGPLIKKSFKEIPTVVSNCATQFLTDLPDSISLVVMLGTDTQYIKQSQRLISSLFPNDSKSINNVAIRAGGKLWIWASHPSGLNGHFNSWLSGEGTSGKKLLLAKKAILTY